MDGPVVLAAKKAIEHQNVNYVLIWVDPESESELKNVFNLIMKVRGLSEEAKILSDKYFFESLIRLHRTGEGISYLGIKPSGTPIDRRILIADRCIETGDASQLHDLVPKWKYRKFKSYYDTVMILKNYDVNNVQQGRRYVAAYVKFLHFPDDMNYHHHPSSHMHSRDFLPWFLFLIFLFTTIIFSILLYKKSTKGLSKG